MQNLSTSIRLDREQTAATNMENRIPKEVRSFNSNLEVIQKAIIYITMILIPIAIFPLPWDWANYIKGSILAICFILFLTVEILKVFNTGRVSMYRSDVDIVVFLIIISLILSTLFSIDLKLSLWGFDHRLATGGVIMILTLLFSFLARTILKSKNDLAGLLLSIVGGISLSALLALLSFKSVNIVGYSEAVYQLFAPGTTTFALTESGFVVWAVGLALSIPLFIWMKDQTSTIFKAILFALALVITFALIIFSIAVSIYLSAVTAVIFGAGTYLVYVNRKDKLHYESIFSIIVLVLLTSGFLVVRFESVRERMMDIGAVTGQVKLNSNDSWEIVSSSLTSSISRGLLGVGVDTYSIYYNIHRPAVSNNYDLSQLNLTNANNEFLTIVGDRGVVGALLWLAVGLVIFNSLYKDGLAFFESNSNKNGLNLAVTLVVTYLYLSSFIVYLGFMGYFMIGFVVLLSSSIRALNSNKLDDTNFLNFKMFVDSTTQSRNQVFTIGTALLLLFVSSVMITGIVNRFTGAVYAAQAESSLIKIQRDLDNGSITTNEDLSSKMAEVINTYSEAIGIDQDNTVYRRRVSLILIDYASGLIGQFEEELAETAAAEESSEETEFEEVILDAEAEEEEREIVLTQEQILMRDEINRAITSAIEFSERATDISPNVYSNWNTRSIVATTAINFGYTSNLDSTISAITSQGIVLNPLDNLQYYRLAQLYIVKEDYVNAINAVNTGLQINPNNIETLLLGAELAVAVDELGDARNLLDRAKSVLEAVQLTESELYTAIVDRIAQIDEATSQEGEQVDPQFDELEELE